MPAGHGGQVGSRHRCGRVRCLLGEFEKAHFGVLIGALPLSYYFPAVLVEFGRVDILSLHCDLHGRGCRRGSGGWLGVGLVVRPNPGVVHKKVKIASRKTQESPEN